MNISTPVPDEEVRTRQVVIYPGEDGYWVVECPGLPGCISQGRTREESTRNIWEAVQLYLETLEDEQQDAERDRND